VGYSLFEFRDLFTKDDIKVYAAVVEKPGDSFPNAAKWYDVVSSHVASRFVPLSLISLFFMLQIPLFLFFFFPNSDFGIFVNFKFCLSSFPGNAQGVRFSAVAAPAEAAPAKAVCVFSNFTFVVWC